MGALKNSNFCVEQAKGDYFLLLHDDDLIDNDFVDTCMKAVQNDISVGVILTGMRIIDENGTTKSEYTNKAGGLSTTNFILSWFDCQVSLFLCSTVFNTRRLKELGGFGSKKNLYDDGAVLFPLAAKYGRKDIHDAKASFRSHSTNSGSLASVADWCEDSLYLLDVICNSVPDAKDILRREGMIYFTKANYAWAVSIPSPLKRLYAYLVVYKSFNYSFTLIHCVLGKNIIYRNVYRVLQYMKRKVKGNVQEFSN
jgi:hypothetical protein